MLPTQKSSTGQVLVRALVFGAVAGVRSVSAPALLSRAASRGEIGGIERTKFAVLASPRTARLLTLLAIGEL